MIPNHKGEILFVVLIIPFILGIGAGLNFLTATYITTLTILLLLFSLTFITLNLTYKKLNIYKINWIGGGLISIILLLFGCVSVLRYNELNRDDHFSKLRSQYVVVQVNNEPILKNGWLRFRGQILEHLGSGKPTNTNGSLLVSIKDSLASLLYYGDELLIPANYSIIDPPFNPAEFNYKQYLAYQNIHYQSFLYPGQYKVLGHNTGNPLMAYALQLRQRLVEKFKINMHNPQAIAVASTLILGYRANLSNDILQTYSQTGTLYVLSVSGAQVGIIYIMLSLALGFLNRFKYGKVLRAVLIIAALSYYCLLTGFSPAVCRAVLMLCFIIVGKTYNRYINSLNLLAASAFLLLLIDPYYVTEVGFQLVYVAVGGLIILRPIVYKWLKFKNRWADKAWQLCSISIAAQVITFPLSAFYFHQFPVYFLLSNLLVFIPATFITYAGIIYLLLPQIPFVSNALGYVLERSILLMDKTLSLIEHAPFAAINKIRINTAEYLLLYAIVICLFYFIYDKRKWLLKTGLICTLLLCISISFKKINSIQTNNIAFLNIGKHVGIVMKSGTNARVISDLSDTDRNYKYSIQPYLDSSKIEHISLYNLTDDIRSDLVLKKYNFIQFLNKKIMLFNGKSGNIALTPPLKLDYAYLTGNPYTAIKLFGKNNVSNVLVVDGSNSNHFISSIKKQTSTMQKYVVLKRNKSLLVVSN
jgi:competence protein ComEC